MIISCLLTRRCNLSCSYCRIIRNYPNKPDAYPCIEDYKKNEVSYKLWCDLGIFFKPKGFMLLYGGEPTLYKDLEKIIDFYNENQVPYSIITNATNPDWVLDRAEKLFGLTTSVDPGSCDKSRNIKSSKGWKLLVDAKKKNPKLDCVAEVVLDKSNYKNLEALIKRAMKDKIRLSVTIIEKPENKYYDFAELESEKLLLNKKQCKEILEIIEIYEEHGVILNPHAIKEVLKKGSQNLDCDISREMFYVIDSDFKPRLCLRTRGVETPTINLEKYVQENNYLEFYEEFQEKAGIDKKLYCQGCSWTCAVMGTPDLLEK